MNQQNKTTIPHLDTFPLVVHLLLIQNDKILLLRRTNTKIFSDYWSLPAGKVESGETPAQAAVREAQEELGIAITKLVLKTVVTVKSPHIFDASIAYQDIGFFFQAVEFEGILLNAEPHMHDEMAWFALDNLPTPIIPNVKQGIEQVVGNTAYGEWSNKSL